MTQLQIQLTEEQAQRLERLAQRKDRSVSELVQQAVASLLVSEDEAYAEKRRRAAAVIGCVNSGLGDLAERHDDYLDEIYGT